MSHSIAPTPHASIFKTGAISAFFVLAMIPVQALVYFLWPPPETVLEYFQLFQENPFLAMVDLDLLLTIDYIVMVILYIALFFALRKENEPLMIIALIFGLISFTLYLFSREATFTMWVLSNDYFAAPSNEQQAALLGSGETLLAMYTGGTFSISYILGGIFTFLVSFVMLKSHVFSKFTAWIGLIMALFMLVPPTVGWIGMLLSFLSLIPTMIWLILVGMRLFKLAKDG